jgi:type II secretory pathway component PulK
VEELLLIDGVTPSLLYGQPTRTQSGDTVMRRGLIDLLTVYSEGQQVNVNYAEPEALAALPGIGPEVAQYIVQERATLPFSAANPLTHRILQLLQGEALSRLTSEPSQYVCVIATAQVRGSRVRRSVRLVAKRDSALTKGIDRLAWCPRKRRLWPTILSG